MIYLFYFITSCTILSTSILWFSLLVTVVMSILKCNSSETCLPDEFRCNDGECIMMALYCDGVPHCHDSSDEDDSCSQNKNRIGLFSFSLCTQHFALLIVKTQVHKTLNNLIIFPRFVGSINNVIRPVLPDWTSTALKFNIQPCFMMDRF